MGECGLRGGYFEILGMPEAVKAQILKLASINLCSNTIGQITTGLMVNPPEVGESSHSTYVEERDDILASLKRRAAFLSDALNDMEGVSSTTIDGSMYAFPTINLPPKAIEAARKAHMQPDAMYCTELLENTGIVVVPGSGFGQKEGTYHFRITILPPEDSMHEVIKLLKEFHIKFTQQYS
jgi:alanine transaminase